jgi:hypothetical protein
MIDVETSHPRATKAVKIAADRGDAVAQRRSLPLVSNECS